MGGKNICDNVCDACNEYFGNPHKQRPAIEVVFKEAFYISRLRLLDQLKDIGKGKLISRPKSEYFDIKLKRQFVDVKNKYKLRKGFQRDLLKILKRGLYKVFLEENERLNHNSLDKKFDFIREFARYGIGDFPLFYFKRRLGIIAMGKDWARHPELLFGKNKPMNYLIEHPAFVEFEFLGHTMAIPMSRTWELDYENYAKMTAEAKKQHFVSFKQVQYFNEIDLLLSVLND